MTAPHSVLLPSVESASVSALAPTTAALHLLRGPALAAADDVGVGPALLQEAATAGHGGWLRVYAPAPALAFSRRDTLHPGFGRAARISAEHGFTPVLRAPGGRAAAYHPQALCVDLVVADDEPRSGSTRRFVELADLLVEALVALGVDARVGPVPDEYCPGRHSVNGQGRVKLAGTAQRVVRGGWFLGAVVLVDGAARVRDVIAPVYEALGLHVDVATVGAVADLAPGVDVHDVVTSVLEAFGRRIPLRPVDRALDLVERARRAALAHPDLDPRPLPTTHAGDR